MKDPKILLDQLFAPLPLIKEPPESSYRKLWRHSDQSGTNKLYLTVVENPALQIIKNDKRVRRFSNSKAILSNECVPPNAVKITHHKKLPLSYFRSEPFTPFIPDLLLYGINKIESDCHRTHDWSMYYNCHKKADKAQSDELLEFNVTNPTHSEELKDLIRKCSSDTLAWSILRFLTIFEHKILHIDTINLMKILNEPLYDKFLRPNPGIKEIVRACVLKSSRTVVDTLAFIMIHILHIWEYSNMPHKTKIKLSRLFGPRLLSFEDPIYLLNTDDISSPQSAMLEAILEICDHDFWLTMNFNQRKEVFDKETDFERKRSLKAIKRRDRPLEFAFMCNPYSLFPNVNESWQTEDDEQYKNTHFYKRLLKMLP